MHYLVLMNLQSIALSYTNVHLGREACCCRGLLRGTGPESPCRCLAVLWNGLLLGAELEEVSSHDHGFEGVPCLNHVVLCERGLAFFRRLWARC